MVGCARQHHQEKCCLSTVSKQMADPRRKVNDIGQRADQSDSAAGSRRRIQDRFDRSVECRYPFVLPPMEVSGGGTPGPKANQIGFPDRAARLIRFSRMELEEPPGRETGSGDEVSLVPRSRTT